MKSDDSSVFSWRVSGLIWSLEVVIFYSFVTLILSHVNPFETNEIFSVSGNGDLEFLENFFEAEISVIPGENPKNLILIEVESLEKQLVGTINPVYSGALPFIAQLLENHTSVAHVAESPYTSWSVASMFASQCNMPLIVTPDNRYNTGSFHVIEGHKCLGDYLHAAGYHLFSFQTGVFAAKFRKSLELHHWEVQDAREHHFRQDWDLFQMLETSVLDNLSKKENQPFALHIANTDTHSYPRYYLVDERCLVRVSDYPVQLQSFDCIDQILERFVEEIKKRDFANNTEVIIFGDHLIMDGTPRKGLTLNEPRSIVAAFPLRGKRLIDKDTSIYDFAPTLLDLSGITYKPKFPFGRNLFDTKPGISPDRKALQFIYNYFKKKLMWKDDMICIENGLSGPCNSTTHETKRKQLRKAGFFANA